jgi:TRAP-type C4-dicarboxylate transport system substrate-binding protein
MSRPGRRWAALAGLSLSLCLLSACVNPGSSGNKAGSRSPVVLSLANTAFGPGVSLTRFAEVVDRLSGGEVRIKVVNAFGSYAADAQIQAVRAVAAGELDMGLVGSNAFDSVGVTSLEALSAPLLIDSYALENAVLADPLADRLLEGLGAAGVTGLGMGPGHFQLPIARDRALLGTTEAQGVSVGT